MYKNRAQTTDKTGPGQHIRIQAQKSKTKNPQTNV